jgi:hypothetical protein
VGTFLLAALDTDEARAMLNAQTAALVCATVLHPQVEHSRAWPPASQ